IVDNKFFSSADDLESRAERKPRPIGGGAHHVTAGQIGAEGISTSAFFDACVSGRPDIGHATAVRIRGLDRGQRFLHYRLLCATNQDTTNSENYCKAKAFRHLQHRGLRYHRTSAGQVIISCEEISEASFHPRFGSRLRASSTARWAGELSRAMRTARRFNRNGHGASRA